MAAEIRKLRDDRAAIDAAMAPARRAALEAGPVLRDLDAAIGCGCACHPRPSDPGLHEGGVTCPCQLTAAERAESLEELLELLSDGSEEQEAHEGEMRRRADVAAASLGVELRAIGGAAPFVIRGVVDGRGFYLRERHDVWSVVVAPDDDPVADPWMLDRRVPVIVVASGESSALECDGVFDPVRALEVAVDAARIFLLRRSCLHHGAVRFCPVCGVEVSMADAWRVEARREDR